MKVREFESATHSILVLTENYKKFKVWLSEYKKDFSLKTAVYAGCFNEKDIKGAFNSEKLISNFIEKTFRLKNVCSVNDFKEV